VHVHGACWGERVITARPQREIAADLARQLEDVHTRFEAQVAADRLNEPQHLQTRESMDALADWRRNSALGQAYRVGG
jgi:hypothetical protein